MKAWLQLFRVPNLLTVPGDPLAGFIIATGGRLDSRAIPAVIACLCLYAAGLAMNDLADAREDAQERPNRPIPSGRIALSTAWGAVAFLCALAIATLQWGMGDTGMFVGLGLLFHIALYNFLTKRIPVLGAINMGLCRGVSMALGAVAGFGLDTTSLGFNQVMWALSPDIARAQIHLPLINGLLAFSTALFCGAMVAIYIAAVTNLARFETRREYPRLPRMLPLLALLLGYIVLKGYTGAIIVDQSPTLWMLAMVLCGLTTSQLMKDPAPPLPPRIGAFIRLLPILQAALCLLPTVPYGLRKTPDSFVCAVVLLLFVPLHSRLAKKFYAS